MCRWKERGAEIFRGAASAYGAAPIRGTAPAHGAAPIHGAALAHGGALAHGAAPIRGAAPTCAAQPVRVLPAFRYLSAILACVALGGTAAATPAPLASTRDGAWLQNGIKQHDMPVTSYVCAVADLEKYLVQRAATLTKAVHDGKKKKKHLDPQMLTGMMRALPLVLPLMDTDFLKDDPSCDKTVVIVRDYLDKYPEMLPKDADVIVERALLDAYTKAPEQP